jgi:hypothetical protein
MSAETEPDALAPLARLLAERACERLIVDFLRRLDLRSRPGDRLSQRMCTNILVTVDSPTTAAATSYFATYRVDGYTGGMLPPRLPANVGHYEDTFRKENGTWLLATRTTFLPFGGPTERVSPPGRP